MQLQKEARHVEEAWKRCAWGCISKEACQLMFAWCGWKTSVQNLFSFWSGMTVFQELIKEKMKRFIKGKQRVLQGQLITRNYFGKKEISLCPSLKDRYQSDNHMPGHDIPQDRPSEYLGGCSTPRWRTGLQTNTGRRSMQDLLAHLRPM